MVGLRAPIEARGLFSSGGSVIGLSPPTGLRRPPSGKFAGATFSDSMVDQFTPPTRGEVRRFHRQQAYYSALRSKQELTERAPLFTNWDYNNWRMIWQAIRHAMIGEVEVKRHGHTYLPQPDGMDEDQYAAYLDRAVFYNMVYRTVTGLTGAIFRRDPRVLNAGPRLEQMMPRVSKDGLSLAIFAKVIAQEMLSVGRYGVLVDKSTNDGPNVRPYLAGYTCENILDWSTIEIDGRDEYDYILLREFDTDRRLYILEGNEATQENVMALATQFD